MLIYISLSWNYLANLHYQKEQKLSEFFIIQQFSGYFWFSLNPLSFLPLKVFICLRILGKVQSCFSSFIIRTEPNWKGRRQFGRKKNRALLRPLLKMLDFPYLVDIDDLVVETEIKRYWNVKWATWCRLGYLYYSTVTK